MIVTNDDRIAEESRIYRDQGKASFTVNAHVRMGYNWRMSEPHAIIGFKHLERFPAMIADRQAIAAFYDQGLARCENLDALQVPADGTCNYYKYIAVLKEKRDRKELKTLLRDNRGLAGGRGVRRTVAQAAGIRRILRRPSADFRRSVRPAHLPSDLLRNAGIGRTAGDLRTETSHWINYELRFTNYE